ncbi:hypothetical protein AK812_SmicGene3732 [Symbiodinium microadriaticum]|uniref:Aspartyl/asparaginy/proline hydroxylase domain-containing protein n=1 Tax=Symbiodinium microadriaticum TaxID=2951 RepID=A0A1Q9EY94_SYMMI|nr:hypothetical protein AK812_SmicGene3732 [Symbiodinium microadriaticum]
MLSGFSQEGMIARVGEQRATLTQGGVLVFDPTFVHTVKNLSEAEMYLFYCSWAAAKPILVCHFYHPQITEATVWFHRCFDFA